MGTVAGPFAPGAEDGTMDAPLRSPVDLGNLDFVTVLSGE